MSDRRGLFGGWAVLLFSAVVVVLDQATKLAIRHYFLLYDSRPVLGDFLRLTYVENPGMAFSLQLGDPLFLTIFGMLASMVILILMYRLREERFLTRFSLALVFGGALGNLIDRFAHGGVVDFIEINVGSLNFPVFNLADAAVTVGMCILIVVVLIDKEPSAPERELRDAYAPKAKAGTTDEERIWGNVP
jgi:signal peptidase II